MQYDGRSMLLTGKNAHWTRVACVCIYIFQGGLCVHIYILVRSNGKVAFVSSNHNSSQLPLKIKKNFKKKGNEGQVKEIGAIEARTEELLTQQANLYGELSALKGEVARRMQSVAALHTELQALDDTTHQTRKASEQEAATHRGESGRPGSGAWSSGQQQRGNAKRSPKKNAAAAARGHLRGQTSPTGVLAARRER